MLRKRYAHSDVISIHSLVKRETIEKYGYPVISKISIHSLVKRETNAAEYGAWTDGISIHSLVKRETANQKQLARAAQNFNPLPRKEGDVTVTF